MTLTDYPQTPHDIKIGLRLLCKDKSSLKLLAYTKPLYAIVTNKFIVNGELIVTMRFVNKKGDFITKHEYHVTVVDNKVQFEQIQSLYDYLIVSKPKINLISS